MSIRAGSGILYSSYYGDLDGGGELRMLDHIRGSSLGTVRFSVLVFKRGDLADRLREWEVPVEFVPWSWGGGPRRSALHLPWTLFRVLLVFLRVRPRLLIANTYLDLTVAGPVAALLGVPILWRSRGELFPNLQGPSPRRIRIVLWFLRRFVTRIVPTTEYDRKLMVERGVPAGMTRTIYNGVDVGTFARATDARARIRNELGVATDAPVLAFVGRLTPLKGHRVFLDALARLRAEFPALHALIVGYSAEEPQYVAELTRRVGELGLERTVTFTGYRSDVADILRAVDLFVMASFRETFGTAVIEAMAAGLPVVATRTPGPLETIDEGRTGLLVPIGDAVSLAEAIATLLRDPERMRAMGDAARARAREAFDIRACLGQLDAECEAALAGRAGRGGAE